MQRVLKFLKYWDFNQYHLTVVTVKPSFFYAQDGKLLEEIPSPVRVLRTGSADPFRLIYLLKKVIPLPKSTAESQRRESSDLLRRIAGYLFLPDSRLLWLPFALVKIRRLHRRQPVDLIVATLPPFTTGLVGYFANRLLKIPYLLDFRDAWTNNPYLPQMTSVHDFLQSKIEAIVVRRATGMAFVNPNLQQYYMERYPFLSRQRCRAVRNGFDPEDFANVEKESTPPKDDIFRVGILGTVYSQGNAPYSLLEALSRMKHDDPDLANRFRLVFVGKWAGNFLSRVSEYHVDDLLEWVDYLPHQELLRFARQLDALCLAIQTGLPGSENVTPGRIYEYLALHKPILALCPLDSDLARLVWENNAGEVVDYPDVSRSQSVLTGWLADPRVFHSTYSFRSVEKYRRDRISVQFMRFVEQILPEN